MMQLAKLLFQRILSRSIPICSPIVRAAVSPRIHCVGNRQNLVQTRRLGLGPYQHIHTLRSRCQLNFRLHDLLRYVYRSTGWKLNLGTIFGLSITTGFLCSLSEYAHAERDQQGKVWDASTSSRKWDEGQPKLLAWARKLWIPMLLVMTVMMGWNYPASLAVNILFLLLSTKPTPSSIYLWVEQWRQQSLHESHGFEWLTLGPALHVEVRDYKLLCLAQVTSINHRMAVIGILGEWWILYSSSSRFNFVPLFAVSPFVREF